MSDIERNKSPRSVFAQLKNELNLPSDTELADTLGITPEYLSSLKQKGEPLSGNLQNRVQELLDQAQSARNAKNMDPPRSSTRNDAKYVSQLKIKRDLDIQQRTGINPQVISDYADVLKDKQWPTSEWPFPPLDVFNTPEKLVLVDGFHRFDAACEVLGDNRDAGRSRFRVAFMRVTEITRCCSPSRPTRPMAFLGRTLTNAVPSRHFYPTRNGVNGRPAQSLKEPALATRWSTKSDARLRSRTLLSKPTPTRPRISLTPLEVLPVH